MAGMRCICVSPCRDIVFRSGDGKVSGRCVVAQIFGADFCGYHGRVAYLSRMMKVLSNVIFFFACLTPQQSMCIPIMGLDIPRELVMDVNKP